MTYIRSISPCWHRPRLRRLRRRGKEGAAKSEMQITLDWVSPSQTSPRRTHSQPRLSRSSLMILGYAIASTNGRAGRGFCLAHCGLCATHIDCCYCRYSIHSGAESKAWKASVKQIVRTKDADIAYWLRPTQGSGKHRRNLRLTTFDRGRGTAKLSQKSVTLASQARHYSCFLFSRHDDGVFPGARWSNGATCLSQSSLSLLRRRSSDHFLPGISDLHGVLSHTHVTCHSFQPVSISISISIVHPLQRAAHGTYGVKYLVGKVQMMAYTGGLENNRCRPYCVSCSGRVCP